MNRKYISSFQKPICVDKIKNNIWRVQQRTIFYRSVMFVGFIFFQFIILVGKYFLNNSNLRSFRSSSSFSPYLANYIGYTIVRVHPSLNLWPNSLAYCGPTMGQKKIEIAFFLNYLLKFSQDISDIRIQIQQILSTMEQDNSFSRWTKITF